MVLFCFYWIGLDWIGKDWIGKDWKGFELIGKDWIGKDWIGKVLVRFCKVLVGLGMVRKGLGV